MSDQENKPNEEIVEEPPFLIKDFFEKVPPGRDINVFDMREYNSASHLRLPDILLHCDEEKCKGDRLFKARDSVKLTTQNINTYVYYVCKNCEVKSKVYAISAKFDKDQKSGLMFKFGEYEQFGPPISNKVSKILGSEREYYFKGRQSENQGLGIAAFAYYRRVVENQKNKIFDEIINTVNKIDSANTDLIKELNDAKRETQFTKAVAAIKHAIPQIILIEGHNPLTLLHSALSEGLHAETDEQCLEIATSIRIVLTEMMGRMSTALKDTSELKSAVSKILNK